MLFSQLFLGFLRVGLLGYGGGPSSIPLVQKEAVEKYKWMTEDEFSDMLAIANALPGPIITKMSGYIGYRKAGWGGLFIGLLASILPTIIAMILLFIFLSTFQNQPWVKGMTHAVIPVVAVMLATLTWQFFTKSRKDLGWLKAVGMIVGSILFIEVFHLHPAIVIAAILIYVFIRPTSLNKKEKTQDKGRKAL
jgi:chromate transporter